MEVLALFHKTVLPKRWMSLMCFTLWYSCQYDVCMYVQHLLLCMVWYVTIMNSNW
jgi:hypothetical protein